MAENKRTFYRCVPNACVEIAMKIAAANSSGFHAHKRLTATGRTGTRHALHAQTLRAMQTNAQHGTRRTT